MIEAYDETEVRLNTTPESLRTCHEPGAHFAAARVTGKPGVS